MKFLTEKLTPAMYAWLAIRSGSTRISANNDLEHELGESVARQLMRIESFSKGPFVPITLRILLEWMERGSASAIDLGANLHLIETYAARALLSAEPFSPMRRNIRNLCTALENGTTSLENWVREHSASDERIRLVMEQSCSIEGTENPPDKWISERDLGERSEPRQLTALFDGLSVTLEGPLSKMIVRKPNKRMKRNTKNPFWIEHYYPQKARRWEVDLEHWGVNPEHMENRLNAIGNLSVLTNFGNAKMSNKPLAEKQTDYREAKVPAFKLNLDFMTADRWTTKEIDERTRMLVRAALEFWRLPAAP
jgi:hypothetical protein